MEIISTAWLFDLVMFILIQYELNNILKRSVYVVIVHSSMVYR